MYGREGGKKALGLNHVLPHGIKAELRTCLVLWKEVRECQYRESLSAAKENRITFAYKETD